MSTVPRYAHDVFFCFANEDNAELPGSAQTGWVDELVECVAKLLPMLGVARARVTASLPAHVPAEARIEALGASATVVVVLSPAFFVSEWCNGRYLHALRALAAERPNALIIVEKTQVSREDAAELDAHPRSVFWRIEHGVPRTLGFPSIAAAADPPAYYARVSDLATALATHLKQPPAARTPDAPATRPKIYLADCPRDVEERRLEVLRYLEQAGFDVVPRGRLPTEPERWTAEAHSLIAGAMLFVQLLGEDPEPDGVADAAQRQLDIAANEHREILQWRDPALDVASVRDPALRQRLLRETVQADSIPAFCHAVKAAALRTESARTATRPIVFVDVSRDQVEQLERIFGRYQEIQWDWHEPKRTDLKRILRMVDGVVLYWGSEGSDRAQTRYYLFQSHFKALKKSSKRLLIYDGPPPDKPEFQGAGTWPVAKGRHGGEPVELQDFLRDISRG